MQEINHCRLFILKCFALNNAAYKIYLTLYYEFMIYPRFVLVFLKDLHLRIWQTIVIRHTIRDRGTSIFCRYFRLILLIRWQYSTGQMRYEEYFSGIIAIVFKMRYFVIFSSYFFLPERSFFLNILTELQ